MNKICKIAKKTQIKNLRRCLYGNRWKNIWKKSRNLWRRQCDSMHPLKSLNVMGDGGMIVTNNSKIAKWLDQYRNHGMKNRDEIDFGASMQEFSLFKQ